MFFKTDLENYTQGAVTLDDYIDAFEKMCSHRNSVVDDFIYLESGNHDYAGTPEFYVSLVRQYRDNVFSDDETQTRLDIIYAPQQINIKNRRKLKTFVSSDQNHGSFSRCLAKVRASALVEYINAQQLPIQRVEITEHLV